ncbi:MAG TPA: serine/threonine-protein kinase [Candidatus Angelobacter sp.]|nr:serine/threonine-protein kinase [Candidatus Angelobacter sp.]
MSVQTVGRYEITGELGRGAMGVVYKAQDPTIGRTVALKTMRLDVHGLETADVLRRFRNEARAAGVLNHPNIVTIHDAGEQDGMFYIAMEFIEGTTLQTLLVEKRVLRPEETIRICRQIGNGLDYAHSTGIVHRDIKPANIMITPNGTVKIMDFGIAKAGSGMTSTGQMLGTPNYMSPEQVKGKVLDGRSDLFSLGVILYEMVTGEKPFVGQSATTIAYKIAHENPVPPRDLDGTIHHGLSMVVSKALAKAPDERYQTGAELIKDLENYKSGGSSLSDTGVLSTSAVNLVNATPPVHQAAAEAAVTATAVKAATEPPLATPVAHKKRGVLALVLTTVLLATAALAGYFFYLYRTTRKMQEADRVQQQKATQEQRQAALAAAAPKTPENQQEATPGNTTAQPPKPDASPDKAVKSQGELRLDSQPPGASVKVDGGTDPTWITPFKASHLSAGKHTLVFSKTGYAQEERTVTVTAGKSVPFSIQLSPAGSRLQVSSTPPGANIEVDGKDTGKITPAEVIVEKGEHTVLVRKLGFSDFLTTQTLGEGQTVNLSPALAQPALEMQQLPGAFKKIFTSTSAIPSGKGLVQIHTKPAGATIQVGDRIARRKTNASWPVDPGTYELVLTLDGYKPIRRTVRVQKGKEVSVDETLEKQP